MTVYSQNGWPANDRSLIASYTVPGTNTKYALRIGDVSVVLLDYFAWFNRTIEPLDGGIMDDWGYAERPVRGSTTGLSNHASGTAGDTNATRHPLGVRNTFAPWQRDAIRARIALYRGALRWGGDYVSRPDDMHAEINAGSALVRAVADDIRAGRITGGTHKAEAKEEDEMDHLIIGVEGRPTGQPGKPDRFWMGPDPGIGIDVEYQKYLMGSDAKIRSAWSPGPVFDALVQDATDKRDLLRAQAAKLRAGQELDPPLA